MPRPHTLKGVEWGVSETAEHKLGRYRLRRELGRGSQGRVYLARDPELDREVAVKLLTSDKAEFLLKGHNGAPLEALTAGKLKHRNIIPIHDIGESAVGPYLVFGFVNGRTIAVELATRGYFDMPDAVPLIAQILDAVATAHAAGVVHLDRATSCWTTTGSRRSWISGWPSSSTSSARTSVRPPARCATWHRSISCAGSWGRRPTCSRWRRRSTRC